METKICSKCGRELPLEQFHWRNKTQGTRRSECKECHNTQVKIRYQENKNMINQSKQGKCCARCGYNECLEALEFHHKNPEEKKDSVARLSTHYSLEDGIKEIEKCILLCANCHRYFHYLERVENISLEEFIQR